VHTSNNTTYKHTHNIHIPFKASSCLPSCINLNPIISPSLKVCGFLGTADDCSPPPSLDTDAVDKADCILLLCKLFCCGCEICIDGIVVNDFVHDIIANNIMENRDSDLMY